MTVTSPKSQPIRWLLLTGSMLIAAIGLVTAIFATDLRERALKDKQREMENTVLLLAKHFDQQLEQLALIESGIVSEIRSAGITSREEFDRRMSVYGVHRALSDKKTPLPYVSVLGLSNSEGRVVNSTYSWPAKFVDIADREFFQKLKSLPEAISVLSPPVVGNFTGLWTTVLASRMTGEDGRFSGSSSEPSN